MDTNQPTTTIERHGVSFIALIIAILCSCILPSCGTTRSITEQVRDAVHGYRFVPVLTGTDSVLCVGFRLSDSTGHEVIATDGAPLLKVEPLCVSWDSFLAMTQSLHQNRITP
jgi:hypothetical protein